MYQNTQHVLLQRSAIRNLNHLRIKQLMMCYTQRQRTVQLSVNYWSIRRHHITTLSTTKVLYLIMSGEGCVRKQSLRTWRYESSIYLCEVRKARGIYLPSSMQLRQETVNLLLGTAALHGAVGINRNLSIQFVLLKLWSSCEIKIQTVNS
jgi:hypothetical protein